MAVRHRRVYSDFKQERFDTESTGHARLTFTHGEDDLCHGKKVKHYFTEV